MKLGLALGYWGAGMPDGMPEIIRLAEDLDFDSIWTAEAYGSDALTPLAWWGSQTRRVKLGTAITQMAARTPVATAMAAMTMDHLTGGRFVLGLGASGPQVVEGWYGQPYPRPLERTREYVEILRRTMARERVSYDGVHFQLPLTHAEPGRHGRPPTGLGKSLRSTLHPLRADLPVLLAAEGPRNVALAAEVADGWLPLFYSPYDDAIYRNQLAEGFGRPGARRSAQDFEVVCPVEVVVDPDVDRAADRIRPRLALYIGGMGARDANFHYQVFARMGFEEDCARIQSLYLDGHKDQAAAAVPRAMVERVALVGSREKIAEELAAWRDSLITTLLLRPDADQVRLVAELCREQVA